MAALLLAAALAWTLCRLLTRRPVGRLSWRTTIATSGWTGLGITSAVAAGVWLPAMFDLRLRHLVRFTPDLGQLALAIVVLGSALALARLAMLIVLGGVLPSRSRRSG